MSRWGAASCAPTWSSSPRGCARPPATAGPGFADLFTNDAVLEVPFDGAGDTPPIRGRTALAAMVDSLAGVLEFREVRVSTVLDVDATTVVCEYEALLDRHDLGRRLRRRYIGVLNLRDGLIGHLREYGGPFVPVTDERGHPSPAGAPAV